MRTQTVMGNWMTMQGEAPCISYDPKQQFNQDNTHRCAECGEFIFRHPVNGYEYDVSDPDAFEYARTEFFECADCLLDLTLDDYGTREERKAEYETKYPPKTYKA